MTEDLSKKNIKKILLFMTGGAILVLGITLILNWWIYVTIVFKGVLGIFLALFGLFLLVVAKE